MNTFTQRGGQAAITRNVSIGTLDCFDAKDKRLLTRNPMTDSLSINSIYLRFILSLFGIYSYAPLHVSKMEPLVSEMSRIYARHDKIAGTVRMTTFRSDPPDGRQVVHGSSESHDLSTIKSADPEISLNRNHIIVARIRYSDSNFIFDLFWRYRIDTSECCPSLLIQRLACSAVDCPGFIRSHIAIQLPCLYRVVAVRQQA